MSLLIGVIVYLTGSTLYWVLYNTGEIRSMPVSGSSSTTVIPAAASRGYYSYYLAKKGEYYYYTSRT